GARTARGSDRVFRQCKAGRGVIYSDAVSPIMSQRQLVIGEKESRIARNGLLKEVNCARQRFFLPRAKNAPGTEIFSLHVQIIGDQIRSRSLFNGGFLRRRQLGLRSEERRVGKEG